MQCVVLSLQRMFDKIISNTQRIKVEGYVCVHACVCVSVCLYIHILYLYMSCYVTNDISSV